MDWLVHDWQLFGLHGQVWMALFAAGLAVYVAVLVLVRHYNTNQH
jgi:hypothetical protein